MPLFAAWRAMPIPDDSPGARAAVLAHLLREHRGAAHIIAIRASDLTPLEAIIAGPEGEAGATAFGWQPPYPPFEPLMRRRAWAEAVTDRIAGEAYRVLDARSGWNWSTCMETASNELRRHRPRCLAGMRRMNRPDRFNRGRRSVARRGGSAGCAGCGRGCWLPVVC